MQYYYSKLNIYIFLNALKSHKWMNWRVIGHYLLPWRDWSKGQQYWDNSGNKLVSKPWRWIRGQVKRQMKYQRIICQHHMPSHIRLSLYIQPSSLPTLTTSCTDTPPSHLASGSSPTNTSSLTMQPKMHILPWANSHILSPLNQERRNTWLILTKQITMHECVRVYIYIYKVGMRVLVRIYIIPQMHVRHFFNSSTCV